MTKEEIADKMRDDLFNLYNRQTSASFYLDDRFRTSEKQPNYTLIRDEIRSFYVQAQRAIINKAIQELDTHLALEQKNLN